MERREAMNFIHHFRNVIDRMAEDRALSANHVSLYIALFHHWNRFRFRVPLAIIRDDLMRVSKVASTATYTKCLKDLERCGYLKYEPSYSPRYPSYVYLFNFEKATAKAAEEGAGKGSPQAAEHLLIPEVNLTNAVNNINDLSQVATHKKSMVDLENFLPDAGRTPSLEEVQAFFIQRQSTAAAAKKFYHYYEAIGWKMGGRTPVKNWKASADYWLANPKSAHDENHKLKPGNLHVATVKNYGEPL
jgi:hypothetical protein